MCPPCQQWNESESKCEPSCSSSAGCADAACESSVIECDKVTKGWNSNVCERYDGDIDGFCADDGACAQENEFGFGLCQDQVVSVAEIEVIIVIKSL